ncbi:hypothetical protein MNEG_13835, partial [Monoraphidium neglectum]
MLNGELKARADRLAREAKERSDAERRRREKERLLAERQAARQRAREEEQRARRLAVLAAEQAEAERRAAETEANRGVFFHAQLQAAPTSAAAAAARGIRRAADKIVLPSSAGAVLMAQEAYKNGVGRLGAGSGGCGGPWGRAPRDAWTTAPGAGRAAGAQAGGARTRGCQAHPGRGAWRGGRAAAMFFEVTAPNGARTHAGVLEFSPEVPEGVVLLPDKVQDSLWGLQQLPGSHPHAADADPAAADADAKAGVPGGGGSESGGAGESGRCAGRVRVAYRRLEKGSYVRLQPELRAFHEEVGADPDAMRGALEGALHAVCALTEGDW